MMMSKNGDKMQLTVLISEWSHSKPKKNERLYNFEEIRQRIFSTLSEFMNINFHQKCLIKTEIQENSTFLLGSLQEENSLLTGP